MVDFFAPPPGVVNTTTIDVEQERRATIALLLSSNTTLPATTRYFPISGITDHQRRIGTTTKHENVLSSVLDIIASALKIVGEDEED